MSFYGVSGIIAAGKTRFARILAEELDYKFMAEPVDDNPLLELFYRDRKRYSFAVQIEFLSRRFKQHQLAVWGDVEEWPGIVMDRTIYEDTIFVRMLQARREIEPIEAAVYFRHFGLLKHFMDTPDAIIYLDVPPEVALERMKERGRDMESDLPLDYLKDLKNAYDEFLWEIEGIDVPVVRVAWEAPRDTESIRDFAKSLIPVLEGHKKRDRNRFRRSINQT